MVINYSNHFAKQYKKLPRNVQIVAWKKERVFKENPHHTSLKTHKLSGKLAQCYSFSVNYKYRIIFVFEDDGSATFINIGSHSIYI